MESADRHDLFNRSFSRASTNEVDGAGFADAFLDALASASDEIKEKFTAAGRARMATALLQSILHLAAYSRTRVASDALYGIAQRQSRKERNIEPPMYDLFLVSLLQVVQRYDPEYTSEIGTAWKQVLTPGLEYMKAMYDS